MKIEHCRSCNAEIIWMKTSKGKTAPVNADSVDEEDRRDPNTIFDPKKHMNHFATCPQSKQWRKR